MALPADTVESESTALIARMTAPTSRRQKTINKLVKALKDAGVFAQFYHAWLLNADVQGNGLLDMVGTKDATITGTPTFAANSGFTGSNGNSLNTGWNPSTDAIDNTDFSLSVYIDSPAASANSDLGLFDGTTNGITINVFTGTTSTFRLNGPLRTTSNFSASNDGSGMFTASLKAGTTSFYRNGVLLESAGAYTPAANVNLPMFICALNGAASASGRKIGFVSVGKSLTADQAKALFNAFQTYRETTASGDLLFFNPGVQPDTVTADLIVYGATGQGVLAAYEAKRQGLSVAIVGGWRERHLGGMSSGGLGAVDVGNAASIGGLPRWIFTRLAALKSVSDTVANFEPRLFERVMKELCDPSRTNGLDIPVYWSLGINHVIKDGGRILGFNTVDGRTFFGKQFSDASYEGDLAFQAGCTMTYGREAAGSGPEALNGYLGIGTTNGRGNHQFKHVASNTFYNVDPYQTAGNAASGLLIGVYPDPALTGGVADSAVQAMNFRVTLSSDAKRLASMKTKPVNYDKNQFEALIRHLDAMNTDGKTDAANFSSLTSDIWLAAAVATNVFDVNYGGGLSTDWQGLYAQNYVLGNYAVREDVWRQHVRYTLGFLYTMANGRTGEGDTRITAAVENDFGAYGFDRLQFNDPYPGDPFWFPYQIYLREGRRLVSDYVHNANDIDATDGTAPRSAKTIACASYQEDTHHVLQIADLSGTPRVYNIGNLALTNNGGVDKLSPLPYEIIIPKVSEISNLTVTFAVSATHVGFGSIRLEFCVMQLGQAAGMAAALANAAGTTVQLVDYATLRARLLASPTLSGEVAPVIPLVN
jgi:hypothetical protein